MAPSVERDAIRAQGLTVITTMTGDFLKPCELISDFPSKYCCYSLPSTAFLLITCTGNLKFLCLKGPFPGENLVFEARSVSL